MLKLIKYIPYYLQQYFFIATIDKWSSDRINKFQLKTINRILESAKNVPFYQELYKNNGITDFHLTDLSDIKKLPVIDKALCRKFGYEGYTKDNKKKGII